ncbi:MAG: hypothetical protein ABIH59_03100 [archaeon]
MKLKRIYHPPKRLFFTSELPLKESTFSWVYSLKDDFGKEYVGKLLKSSFCAPQTISQGRFVSDLVREINFAEAVRTSGFTVPVHHGVYELRVPNFLNRSLPFMIMDKIDEASKKEVPKKKWDEALEMIELERELAMKRGFLLPGDFYRNLVFSRKEEIFYMVDFDQWEIDKEKLR